MDGDQHLAAFANAFVIAAKKNRWLDLLARRGKSAFRDSSKLMADLDLRYCKQVDGAWDLVPTQTGIFYDFYSEPVIKSLAEATAEGSCHDAIFSLEPGKLAIHFSHEGWSWLCKR